jgi:Predicted transcription factor, homolog of eukaryotic MBF1
MIMNTFGTRIAEVRKQRALTQQQLGKAIGVDKRVISKYEKDQTVPSVLVAKEIALALDVSLDYLIGSDKALFIDDNEVIHLLKNYNTLEEEVKSTFKNMLKALNIYSQVKETV